MSIESEAERDLALTDEDAENVVGGKKTVKKSTHHAGGTHTAGQPLMIKQDQVYGPVSDTLPDDNCDPEGT
jgi:hypothetical protein